MSNVINLSEEREKRKNVIKLKKVRDNRDKNRKD